MKIFLKAISISIFILLLPVLVFSSFNNINNNSVYDFEAHADVPVGDGSGQGACEGSPGGDCCNA